VADSAFAGLSRRYFRLVNDHEWPKAVRLFYPLTRRTAKEVVIRDASRIAANADAGRIVDSVAVSLDGNGRLERSVGFVTIYASDAKRLRTLTKNFGGAAIVCLKMADGSSEKVFAITSEGRSWLLP
jgi:hypothetical protein